MRTPVDQTRNTAGATSAVSGPPVNRNAVASKTSSAVSPSSSANAAAAAAAAAAVAAGTAPTLSFKAKLKQQIQDLKRAKKAKAQLKLERERQQQLAVERQKKQAAMEEERKLREQERLKREQERLEKIQMKEQERLEKQRTKEKEKLERLQIQEQVRLEKQRTKEQERLHREQEKLRKEEERRQWLYQIEQERRRKMEWQLQQEEANRRLFLQQQQQQQHYYPPMAMGVGLTQFPHMPPHATTVPSPGLTIGGAPPPLLSVAGGVAAMATTSMASPMVGRTIYPSGAGQFVTPSPHHPPNHQVYHKEATPDCNSPIVAGGGPMSSQGESSPLREDVPFAGTKTGESPVQGISAEVKTEVSTTKSINTKVPATTTHVGSGSTGDELPLQKEELNDRMPNTGTTTCNHTGPSSGPIDEGDTESKKIPDSAADLIRSFPEPPKASMNIDTIAKSGALSGIKESEDDAIPAKIGLHVGTSAVTEAPINATPDKENPKIHEDSSSKTIGMNRGASLEVAPLSDSTDGTISATIPEDLPSKTCPPASSQISKKAEEINAVCPPDMAQPSSAKSSTIHANAMEGHGTVEDRVDPSKSMKATCETLANTPTLESKTTPDAIESSGSIHAGPNIDSFNQVKTGVASASPSAINNTPTAFVHNSQPCAAPPSTTPTPQLTQNPLFGQVPTGTVVPMSQAGYPMQSLFYHSPHTMLPPPTPSFPAFPHMAMNPIVAAQMGGWQTSATYSNYPLQPMYPLHSNSYIPGPTSFAASARQHQPPPTGLKTTCPRTESVAVKRTPRKKSGESKFSAILDKLIAAMESPSPFMPTHSLLPEPVVIKRKSDEKFGVNVKFEQRSMLVDNSWLQHHGYLPATKPQTEGKLVKQPAEQHELQIAKESSQQIKAGSCPQGEVRDTQIVEIKPAMQVSMEQNGPASTEGKTSTDSSQVTPKDSEVAEECKPSVQDSTVKNEAISEEDENVASSESEPMDIEKTDEGKPESQVLIEKSEPLPNESTTNGASTQVASMDIQMEAESMPPAHETSESMSNEDNKIADPLAAGDVSMEKSMSVALNKEANTTVAPLSSEAVPIAPKTSRRRRVFVGVMMVLDATIQNDRNEKAVLEEGDIILSIAGEEVAGKKFSEAISLFANVTSSDKVIRAPLVVARMKSKLSPQLLRAEAKMTPQLGPSTKQQDSRQFDTQGSHEKHPEPTIHISSQPVLVTGTFTSIEQLGLANCMMNNMLCSGSGIVRLLGQPLSEEYLQNAIKTTVLANRMFSSVMQQWAKQTRKFEHLLSEEASNAWKRAWLSESEDIRQRYPEVDSWSDSDRSRLRNLPRPSKGCRCGKEDHEYVHDPKCGLYSNLVRLAPPDEIQPFEYNKEKKVEEQFQTEKSLNVVETAFKDRLVKLKTASEMEEAEARFVAQMEKIQVHQCKKAVFAPSLSTMVLSAVMELQSEFETFSRRKDFVNGPGKELNVKQDDVPDDDDEEEEDLPLALLGKRASTEQANQDQKRQKAESRLSLVYLSRLLSFCSKTWGHVFKEPSHSEYAW